MDRRGMPQKWHAAIIGTIFPFIFVVFSYPSTWLRRRSFWTAVGICLAIHLVGIWLLFQYVLARVQHFGTLFWLPVAFVEAVVLLIVVRKVENRLTGKNEMVDLWN